MKKPFDFQSGKSLKVGQKMTVLEMSATEIVVGSLDGKISFGTKPSDPDALAAANAVYTKLKPKQREFRQKQKSAVLAGISGRNSLPELWVLDRHGNVVVENLKQDRDAALKEFATLLQQPEAK